MTTNTTKKTKLLDQGIVPAVLTPTNGSDDQRAIIVCLTKDGDGIIDQNKIDLSGNGHTAVFFDVPPYCREMVKEVHGVEMGEVVSYNDKTGQLIPVTKDQVETWMQL